MSDTPHLALIMAHATARGLDPVWLEAQVLVESGANPWAWNPEPAYRYLWDVTQNTPFRHLSPAEVASEIPPTDFRALAGDRDQEWWAQQASWGLMQILGAVAREEGFLGPYLTSLCDPATNLTFGTKKLAKLLTWAGGDLERALCAFNGGTVGNVAKPYRNQAYADRVAAMYRTLNV